MEGVVMPYEFNPFTEEFDFYLYEPTEYVAKAEELNWGSITDIGTARRQCAPASDSDGNVFYVGGLVGTTTYKDFHKWDAASETWSSLTDFPDKIYGGCGIVDSLGDYHVIGGNIGGSKSSAHYVWDGSSWTTSGSLPAARFYPAFCIDDSDNIYISHGRDSSYSATLFKWSPSTSAFTTLSSASVTRSNCAGDLLDGALYVFCGKNSGGQLNKVEKFDLSSSVWSDVTPSPAPQTRDSLCAATIGGDIHLLGGYTTSSVRTHEIYDGSSIETTSDMPAPARSFVYAHRGQDGKVWFVGGYPDCKDADYYELSSSCYPIEEKC